MKILYISQYFPPEMGAPSARVAELARHWAADGHDVTVLTGFPNHPDGVLVPEYRKRMRRLVWKESIEGVKVIRTWLIPLPNRKPLERVLNYSSFFLSAAITASFLPRADVIIGTSPQLLVPLAAWWPSALKRCPLIFEVRDLWPESLVAVGMGNSESPVHRFLGAIAGFLYRRADHIVVVTPAFKEHIAREWSVAEDKISVIQNGVETEFFSSTNNPEELRRELGLGGRFVVSYIGTIGMAHGLDTVLDAAAECDKTHANVVFLIVGAGGNQGQLAAEIAQRKLQNVRLIGQQPRERIPDFIQLSDVCLVLLKKAEIFKTVIPTKMLEFMAGGRPVVLGVEGQAREILQSAQAGIPIEPENAVELCSAIRRLQQQPELRAAMGRNGRNCIVEHFSRRSTAALYIQVLERVARASAKRAGA